MHKKAGDEDWSRYLTDEKDEIRILSSVKVKDANTQSKISRFCRYDSVTSVKLTKVLRQGKIVNPRRK